MAASPLLRFNIWPSECKQLFQLQHAASYFEGNIYNLYIEFLYNYFSYNFNL